MHSKTIIKGALSGAFMMAALPAAAQIIFENPWLYYRRPVIPLPPPVLIIPPDDVIAPDFDLERCVMDALENNAPPAATLPVRMQNMPDSADPSQIARTYFMGERENNGFYSGNMVMIDHQKDGTGSFTVSSFYLHSDNKDLDFETPQPAGQGTITRIQIAKEDVGPPGPRDTFSGTEAKPNIINIIKTRASYIVDDIRVCMGSGPYIPGTNQLKPQLKTPGLY